MKSFLFLFIISSAVAAPSQAPIFSLQMTYGEKISSFEIRKIKSKFIGTIVSGSVKRERELKKKDVDYVLEKFKGEKARKEGVCPRENVVAAIQEKGKSSQYSACLNSGTELSKKLTNLANLLSSSI